MNFLKTFFLLLIVVACTSTGTESPKKENPHFIKKQPPVVEETVVNPVCYKQCFSWKKAQAIDDECKSVIKK